MIRQLLEDLSRLVESDAEMRDLERQLKRDPSDADAAARLRRLRSRSGQSQAVFMIQASPPYNNSPVLRLEVKPFVSEQSFGPTLEKLVEGLGSTNLTYGQQLALDDRQWNPIILTGVVIYEMATELWRKGFQLSFGG